MAKVSGSARPASRQNNETTPDAAPATAPTRATRGQSREPNEPQQTPRRSGRNARSASVENDVAPVRNAAAPDLTTVDESALGEDDLETGTQDHAGNAISDGASGISGTTGKTSFSVEEMGELDTEIMLGSLTDLYNAGEGVLKSLFPSGVENRSNAWGEMATPSTRANTRYHPRKELLDVYKRDYTTTQEYIAPQNVSRALFEASTVDDIPEGATLPDNFLYKANLAHFLHVLLVKYRESGTTEFDKAEILEGADQAFPWAVAGSSYSHSAFELSITLTRQSAIKRMISFVENPNFNAQALAGAAYFANPEGEDDITAYRYYEALHLDQLPVDQQQACWDRIHGIIIDLKRPFDSDSETGPLDPLEVVDFLSQTYSWDAFLETNLLPFYAERKAELDRELQTFGGVENFGVRVKTAVENRDDLKYMATQVARMRQSKGRLRESMRPEDMRALQEFAPPGAPPAPGMAPVAQMTASGAAPQHGDYVQIDQYAGPDTTSATGLPDLNVIRDLSEFQNLTRTQHMNAKSTGRGRGKGKGKARSFNDRQAGAQRIDFDNSQLTPQSSALGKRSRGLEDDQAEEHWEPTQDAGPEDDDEDGFQTMAGDPAAANARRQTAPKAIKSARQSLSQPLQFHSDEEDASTMEPAAKRRHLDPLVPYQSGYPGSGEPRRNPGAAIPGPSSLPDPSSVATPSTSRAQEYREAARYAKQFRVASQPAVPPRVRRVWSDEETDALMLYISEWHEDDNLHYAAIKRIDESEHGLGALRTRTAEDIRFRARNMRVNFLLARSPDLHPNWDKVQLAKKEIEKLHSRGVPFAQAGLRGAAVNIGDQNA